MFIKFRKKLIIPTQAGFSCLILSPTRELAIQTHEVIQRLLSHFESNLKITTCIGGVNKLDENLSEIENVKSRVYIQDFTKKNILLYFGSIEKFKIIVWTP